MSIRDHAGSGNDLGHLELNDTCEFSAVLNGLLSQYGMSLESEHHHQQQQQQQQQQQMSTTTSGLMSGESPYVSQGVNSDSSYSSVLHRNVNQLDPTYSCLQRGPSSLSESPYNTISRGGSGNPNESPYSAVPRRVSTTSSPYSMVPRGASNSPYSDLSRASGSHDSPYAVSQEDGSPYSSRSSSTVGANSETYLALPNGVNAPSNPYSTVPGNRSVPQNDPYNFQLTSNGPYMKPPNNGMFPGRQDTYAVSYLGISKEVSNRGNHEMMYSDSLGSSDNPYPGRGSDPQYSGAESGASYSNIASGGPGPCGSPYMRLSVEKKADDNSYPNVHSGGNSILYSGDGNSYSSRSSSHDSSFVPGGTGTHEGNYITNSHDIPFSNSKSHTPSQNDSTNSFNREPSVNVLFNPNNGHYGNTGISDRANANGAYSSTYSRRSINMNSVNSQEFEGATLNDMMEMVPNHNFNSESLPEQAFQHSDSFVVGHSKHHEFQPVNCTGFQNNDCKVSGSPSSVERVFQGKDCGSSGCSTAEHSFRVHECGKEGLPMSERISTKNHVNSDSYSSGECSKGLLVQRANYNHDELINPPAPADNHSDDEIEDDFNWDRLL